MAPHEDQLGELTTNIDDAALVVEELQEDSPSPAEGRKLQTIKDALEQASDAADDLISEQGDEAPLPPRPRQSDQAPD